jgi:hypothetical protein
VTYGTLAGEAAQQMIDSSSTGRKENRIPHRGLAAFMAKKSLSPRTISGTPNPIAPSAGDKNLRTPIKVMPIAMSMASQPESDITFRG